MKIRSYFLCFCVVVLIVSSPMVVWGKDASSSPSATVLEKFKTLLEGEIASKVAEFKENVAKVISNKAWPGAIESVSEEEIKLNVSGKPYRVKVDEYTKFEIPTKTKTKATINNLSEGDFIIALGDVDDTGVLNAKKVIKAKVQSLEKEVVWGQVLSISGNLVKIKGKDGSKTLGLDKAITIQYGNDEGLLEDIKIDRSIIAVYEGSASGNLKTKHIYIIPGPTYIKAEKKAASQSGVKK